MTQKLGPKEQQLRVLKANKSSSASASSKKAWVSRKKQQVVKLKREIRNREKQK